MDDTGIFQEIDDALKVDNMEKFLRKYGKLVLAGCVGIVLATAGTVFWKSHVREQNMQRTSVLLEAEGLAGSDKYADAIKKLEELMQKQGSDIPVIEKLQYAGFLLQSGQPDKARAVYNDLEKSGDDAMRTLAAMNADILASNSKSADADNQKLSVTSGQPFYVFASELMALRLQKEGKNKEAHDILENLAADMSLSQAGRDQVNELLSSVKGDKQ